MIPQVWGALMEPAVGDQLKCWAETAPNPLTNTWPCNQLAVSDLGLCADHRLEVIGE